jgi:hypothetical protein
MQFLGARFSLASCSGILAKSMGGLGMAENAEAVVYYPPKQGCPYLAVVLVDGRVMACQPVRSLSEGEMVLAATMKELPRLIAEAKEETDA